MRSEYEYGRRRLRAVVLTIVTLAALAYAGNFWLNHRAPGRPGSAAISSSTPFHIGRIPRSFYASYQIDTRAGPKRVVTTEKTWFLRPFDSRIETWSGTKRLSVRQSAFGAFANFNPSAAPLSIAVPPSLGSGDLRPDATLSDAVRRHVIEKRERRKVYGRVCQVYRAGGPVSAGDLTTYTKGSSDYADFCVDRDGIVVEEWWVSGNKLLRRRVAKTVRVGSVDPNLFKITTPPEESIDKGSITPVPETTKQKLWTLPSAPKGFVRLGRFFVTLPQAVNGNPNPQLGTQPPVSSITDVYVDGPDLVVVDQDPSLEAAAASESRVTIPLHVKGLQKAVLILDARASEVRAETPDGSFIRIFGTVRPSRLIALARELRLTGG